MSESHEVEYRRKAMYRAHFDQTFVTEGELDPLACSGGEYDEVISEVYECSCGRRFLEEHTVCEHLMEVKGDADA